MTNRIVSFSEENINIPTYKPCVKDKSPMFLERRVYQGSSGRVYPLPCVDRFEEKCTNQLYKAIVLENDYVEVMILPELGGRIHYAKDKTNNYEFIYKNQVIKPALIGLSGSWISGGVEFNWPQHHRPSTFMPVDWEVEKSEDGSLTVWLSEHDPIYRMKGMHGICLQPDSSVIEIKVRAYNRTPFVQTFLWWANIAVKVDEGYQSFFPPDVTHVADHAKGSISTYPHCDGIYYGINYGERGKNGIPECEYPPNFLPPHCGNNGTGLPDYKANDLSWYSNIPVPTSYMCLGTEYDFFGGYDHGRKAGLMHVANHHISPGKKQWTWGNHSFGYAWDRNLTDVDGPYIELMAGVYTDNQPDFSFLQPGETKTWSQYLYPVREIGSAQQANKDAALSLKLDGTCAQIRLMTTKVFEDAELSVSLNGERVKTVTVNTGPDKQFVEIFEVPEGTEEKYIKINLYSVDGKKIITMAPAEISAKGEPECATEPPQPVEIKSNDELFITGLHLSQYRHPTRMPEPYWEEALKRDPEDMRCNTAMGKKYLDAGAFKKAEKFFRTAIGRATRRNPNPYDGEAYYYLGLTLRYQADLQQAKGESGKELLKDAYAAFYKSCWNQAWCSAGYFALAEIDCRRNDWDTALEHLDKSLKGDVDNLKCRNLKVMVLRKLERLSDAESLLKETLALDPLDWWGRRNNGEELTCNSQTKLDLVYDYMNSGFLTEAVELLETAVPELYSGTGPTIQYTLGCINMLLGNLEEAKVNREAAKNTSTDYCFPSRLEEVVTLEAVCHLEPQDDRALYYLGCLFYDEKRHEDAIALWEKSVELNPDFSISWRNLGIGYFNVLNDNKKAEEAYQKALALSPDDARLLYEFDLLWKRLGYSVDKRLNLLEEKLELVRVRDDLSVEYCDLLNQSGQHEKALAYLKSRRFQPWEGGEGLALGQHVRTHLALGRCELEKGNTDQALEFFKAALNAPENLGESKHLLANQSDIFYWLGLAYEASGDIEAAENIWQQAASFKGDFQERVVKAYSEMTYFSGMSLEKLGKSEEVKELFTSLKSYAKELYKQEAKVSYFATSLPTRLLFYDMQKHQETTALLIEAQAEAGLKNFVKSRELLNTVLERDPSRPAARDLLSEIGR